MKRIVSIWLPRFPVDRLRRAARGTSDAPPERTPFALTATSGNAIRLTAVNQAATAHGLYADMMLTDARSMAPGLLTAPAEPRADAHALMRLARWLARYSPWTNVDGTDGVLLDITGCAHLFGGEAKLLADMERRLMDLDLTHRIGLADTAGAAWALARHGTMPIAPPGGTAAALESLPVEGLRLDAETVTLLRRLGLKRIGQLYDFPRAALARRFRSAEKRTALLEHLDRALGRINEPLSPLAPPPDYRAGLSLAEPVQEVDAVAHIVARLAADLCGTLKESGLGAQRFVLDLWRVDGTMARLRVGASRPADDAAHVEHLFAERLEGLDAGFGIDRAVLGAERVTALNARQSSLAPGTDKVDEAALARLLDRLAARFGEDAVTCLKPRDSHIPERAERAVGVISAAAPGIAQWPAAAAPSPARPAHFALDLANLSPASGGEVKGGPRSNHTSPPASGGEGGARGPRQRPREGEGAVPPGRTAEEIMRPFLLLERPEPVAVMAQIPDGPPLHFRWRRVLREVIRAQGPERIAPEWWNFGDTILNSPTDRDSSGAPGIEYGVPEITRDYYRVEDRRGRRYWLYREGLYGGAETPRWFVHGMFG